MSALDRLHRLELAPGEVALWWIGQATFALRAAGQTILIDPWLTPYEGRLVPPPFAPEQATGVDLVLLTHDHLDHIDPDTLTPLAAASPQARFIAPEPVVSVVTGCGIAAERVQGVQPEQALELGGLTVHVLPAVHGVSMEDAYSFGQELSDGLYRYLGYLLDVDGTKLYHSGDTIPFAGLADRLRAIGVDLALLPINGRDVYRELEGLVGNMDHREAAKLAAEVGAHLLVPIHYDAFASNLGYPAHLVDVVHRQHPELAVLMLDHTQPFIYRAPR